MTEIIIAAIHLNQNSEDFTWLVGSGNVSGCVVPTWLGTGPGGSPPVLDPLNLESLFAKLNHIIKSLKFHPALRLKGWFGLTLTWLEQHDGLEAGELCGVDSEGLEAAEGLLQEAQVQGGVAGFALHAGAKVRQGEQRAALQRERPLDGAEQKQLAPRLLQQDHLSDKNRKKIFKMITY